ncbi:hypothetical protein STVIR_6625 [Streptomyces viridochromogenes Tue57]|uniref:Uncharacterized protein n=1 Tax=Streptomyces viridochromogenes Tue57 TaxID=1160705 RepID=L8P7G5_STRVR|nr:hypothetical protein STVIR_6625 [Streptomyces viridochromogenes Tue57]
MRDHETGQHGQSGAGRAGEVRGLGADQSGERGAGLVQRDDGRAVCLDPVEGDVAPVLFPVVGTFSVTFIERRHRTPSRTDRQQGGRAGVALRLTTERRMGASRYRPGSGCDGSTPPAPMVPLLFGYM